VAESHSILFYFFGDGGGREAFVCSTEAIISSEVPLLSTLEKREKKKK